jgi:hypothetical protein
MRYQVLPYKGEAVNMASAEREKILQAIRDLNQAGTKATVSAVANVSGVSNKGTCKTHLTVLENMGQIANAGTDSAHNWRTVTAPQVADLSDIDLGLDF